MSSIQDLVDEINEIMREVDPHVTYFKPIPFLGVVWRPIEYEKEGDFIHSNLRLSKPEDTNVYWIDCAWKWDYVFQDVEEIPEPMLEKILTQTLNVLKANKALLEVLEDPIGEKQ